MIPRCENRPSPTGIQIATMLRRLWTVTLAFVLAFFFAAGGLRSASAQEIGPAPPSMGRAGQIAPPAPAGTARIR